MATEFDTRSECDEQNQGKGIPVADKQKEECELTDKPGSVMDNHSSRPVIAHRLKQSTRFQRGSRRKEPYLILLRMEFTSPHTVTSGAVRSYRTLSPLPHN